MPRIVSLLAALSFSAAAFAQVPTTSPAQQVQQLAPQLLAFSRSAANFESLVNGLTQGTPVTLTAVGADGQMQIVTFAPGTTLSPLDAARTLESARQSLIARGIALPTPQQLAVALMGGALPTASGTTQVTGLLGATAGAGAVQVRTETLAPTTLGTIGTTGTATNLTAAQLQALRAGLGQNTAVTLTGASGRVTFDPTGRTMSDFEVNQALQLASLLLAQQGIFDPTPEQLRVALLGGTLGTAAGGVPVRGVLQGQVRNTSDSRLFGTSDSQVVGTSNTPPNANQPGGAFIGRGASTGTPGPAAAPSPAAPPAASIATVPRMRGMTRR